MLKQYFDGYIESGVSEIEPGIYSTTSLEVAMELKALGLPKYVSVKLYGLGPNLSFVHALLSGGEEWLAEKAESSGLVDPAQIAGLMVLLDSLEEFGMQNQYQSVAKLGLDETGEIYPVINQVDVKTFEIFKATNLAIKKTAFLYLNSDWEIFLSLIKIVPELVKLSKDKNLPLTLIKPIPPMDNKEAHFNKIRLSGLLDYPQLKL